jgi:hypothetical protein
MTCGEAQQAVATALLTRSAVRPGVADHVETCPACAAEQATLRPLAALLSTVRAEDVDREPVHPDELLIERAVRAAQHETVRRRRRARILSIAGVAAAVLVAAMSVVAITGRVAPQVQAVRASAAASGIQATADISPSAAGSTLTLSIKGVAPDTHCLLLVRTADGAAEVIADWTAEYDAVATVSATSQAEPGAITAVQVVRADGPVLLEIPVTT